MVIGFGLPILYYLFCYIDWSPLALYLVGIITTLKSKLQRAIGEVESRERKLASNEDRLKQQHAQKLSELQLLQRRLREQGRHEVEREKQRHTDLEEQVVLVTDWLRQTAH